MKHLKNFLSSKPRAVIAVAMAASAVASARASLTFTTTYDQVVTDSTLKMGSQPAFQAAILQAEAVWSSVITDDINVKLDFAFDDVPTGTNAIGQPGAGSSFVHGGIVGYKDWTDAYAAHATSPIHSTAVSALRSYADPSDPTGNTYRYLLNNSTSSTPALAKHVAIGNGATLPTAVERKLGLYSQAEQDSYGNTRGYDADFELNPDPSVFYFGSPATTPAGKRNLQNLLVHLIGNALGVLSANQDVADYKGQFADEDVTSYMLALDFFRVQRTDSGQYLPAFVDDDTTKYFSYDAGATLQAVMGNTNSGWNLSGFAPEGLTGPDLLSAQLPDLTSTGLSPLDLRLMESLGYSVSPSAVPEPGTASVVAGSGLALLPRRRR